MTQPSLKTTAVWDDTFVSWLIHSLSGSVAAGYVYATAYRLDRDESRMIEKNHTDHQIWYAMSWLKGKLIAAKKQNLDLV